MLIGHREFHPRVHSRQQGSVPVLSLHFRQHSSGGAVECVSAANYLSDVFSAEFSLTVMMAV